MRPCMPSILHAPSDMLLTPPAQARPGAEPARHRHELARRVTVTIVLALAAATLWLLPARASAQPARTPVLTDRAKDAFQGLTAVRELADGDLLVSDSEGAALFRVRGDGSRVNAVRSGTLGAPGALVPMAGDSTLVFDRSNSVFKVLRKDGIVTDAAATLGPPQGPMRLGAMTDLYRADAAGRLYWADRQREPTGVLIRRDVDGTTHEVATLRNPPMRSVRTGAIGMSISTPFAPLDDWDVLPDGTLALARGEPYHVEVIRNGTTARGTPRAVTPVAVSEADRQQFRKQQEQSMRRVNINGMTAPEMPADIFPATKGPFARGQMRVGADGSVWLARSMASDATTQEVDVFGPDGAWRETLALPARSRVVGVGARHVYITVPDGDQQRLKSFAR